jgi:cephalosporin-C deacetylase-like acetyl esterase
MPLTDKPLEELKKYQGTNPKPDDFDAFWDRSLRELDALPPDVEMKQVDVLGDCDAELFHLYDTAQLARIVMAMPEVDPNRVGTMGGSQGGALSLVCAALEPRIRAEVLMGITLMDTICPPSTQFAAFNKITTKKEAVIYPDFGHEGLPGFSDSTFRFLMGLKG